MPSNMDIFTLILLIMTISLILYTLLLSFTQRKAGKEVVKPKILTKISCIREDYGEERDFKKGDYVGLVVGKCPKCEGNLLITAIYLVGSIREKE